ncbi:hypothetical protein [Actinomadura mexicana]|uniref:Uncharacterized protein n=1 Tax=Actinomadura mexicana TaxID=134959 RepID=A0A238UZI4_9ACTN|nr:hypothetical protein [Actinomadura mexicana]SNR26713.1 hypothetical protein SAMN06265355_101563 [Actinomadura mexicana]
MAEPTSPPPPIGTPRWDRELAAIELDRPSVDADVEPVLQNADARDEFDPHTLDFGSDAESAAIWVLLHQRFPSYGILMYLRMCWSSGDHALRDWIVRQFAAMLIHGPSPVAESAEYGLWVDYFESPEASQVFTALALQMPRSHWGCLISGAGPVPWEAKHHVFQAAAGLPALHPALARGLVGSFYDVYGQVDAVDAAALVDRITVADEDLLEALTEATTQPLRLRTGSVVIVDESDPGWPHQGSFLLRAAVRSPRSRWVRRSELVADGRVYGRLVHWDFPFDPAKIAHRTVVAPEPEGRIVLFRVEGAAEHAESLVGRDVEAWPPGLREHLAR